MTENGVLKKLGARKLVRIVRFSGYQSFYMPENLTETIKQDKQKVFK